MTPTVASLVACGIAPTQARLFAAPLATACARFDITTRARLAAFVAQASHESVGFVHLEESLYYRTPERIRAVYGSRLTMVRASQLTRRPQALANAVYAGRLGNGDEASGDGWRFRGRGLFQLTGRANYAVADRALPAAYLTMPHLVAVPEHAALTAAWFFVSRGCHILADAALIDDITEAINGPAMLGADERRSLFDEALQAFA